MVSTWLIMYSKWLPRHEQNCQNMRASSKLSQCNEIRYVQNRVQNNQEQIFLIQISIDMYDKELHSEAGVQVQSSQIKIECHNVYT